jgi:hypothetical protein
MRDLYTSAKYSKVGMFVRKSKLRMVVSSMVTLVAVLGVFVTTALVQRQTYDTSQAATTISKNMRVLEVTYLPTNSSRYNNPEYVSRFKQTARDLIPKASAYKNGEFQTLGLEFPHPGFEINTLRPVPEDTNPDTVRNSALIEILTSSEGNLVGDNKTVCEVIDEYGIDQLWLWFDSEVDKAPGNEWNIIYPAYDSGKIFCGNDRYFTYVAFDFKSGKDLILHTYGHFMEGIVNSFGGTDILHDFSGVTYHEAGVDGLRIEDKELSDRCGSIHVPPNVPLDPDTGRYTGYNYSQPDPIITFCDDWKPNPDSGVSLLGFAGPSDWRPLWPYEDFSQEVDNGYGGGYYMWWMQRIPNNNNGIVYNGKPLPNYWSLIADTATTVRDYMDEGYHFRDGLLKPPSATNPFTSYVSGASGTSVAWVHNSSSSEQSINSLFTVSEANAQSVYSNMVLVTATYSAVVDTSVQVNSITYCGSPMVRVGGSSGRVKYAGNTTEMWYLTSSPSGECDVIATFSGVPGQYVFSATTLNNIDIINPINDFSAIGSPTSILHRSSYKHSMAGPKDSLTACALSTLPSDVSGIFPSGVSNGVAYSVLDIWREPVPDQSTGGFLGMTSQRREDGQNFTIEWFSNPELSGEDDVIYSHSMLCANINVMPFIEAEEVPFVSQYDADHASEFISSETYPTPISTMNYTPPSTSTPVPSSTPPPSSSSYISFEAEQYTQRFSKLFSDNFCGTSCPEDVSWAIKTSGVPSGFSGTGILEVAPDKGRQLEGTSYSTSPSARYMISIPAGNYYVWLRANALGGASDSVHFAVDNGQPSSASDRINLNTGSYGWTSSTMDGSRPTITVPQTSLLPLGSVHTIDMYMREDGARVDQILLTQDANFVPNSNQAINTTPQTGGISYPSNPSPTPTPVSNDPITMEAESYAANISRIGKTWQLETNTSGYSGAGYMRALPDSSSVTYSDTYTNRPELRYNINVPAAGTYYVWVKGTGYSGSSDSLYAGVDGSVPSTLDYIDLGQSDSFSWKGTRLGGSRTSVNIGNAGSHTFSLYMREDGAKVDSVLLTSSASYDPNDVNPTPPSPTPTTPPTSGGGSGLLATYYSGARSFNNVILQKTEANIDFNVGTGVFTSGVPADNFTVRWVGEIEAPASGQYTFATQSDDGVRVFVNDQTVIDNWDYHASTRNTGTMYLTGGQKYPITVEYFEGSWNAVMVLSWQVPGQSEQVVPASRLFMPSTTTGGSSGDGLMARYYNGNRNFTDLILTKVDSNINFDVGTSVFTSGVPSDNFTVRWEGDVEAPKSGTFAFTTESDDGIRLWVNGQKIIDNWTYHAWTRDTGIIDLVAGQKYSIVLEYFEGSWNAIAKLLWSYPGAGEHIVPQRYLFSN